MRSSQTKLGGKSRVTSNTEDYSQPLRTWCLSGLILVALSLRMLAHYLARYDGGRYGDILLNGDIHQVNADKIGISRREVKTVTYAFLYGAGNEKIGISYDSSLSSSAAKSKGKEIREAFVDAIDGLGSLLDAIKHKAECGHVRLVDGRSIAVESPHKALNYLLQGSAGVIAKRWMAINQDTIKSIGIEAHQLAFIHDELQFETTLLMLTPYKHPWYVALQKQANITDSDAQSKLKQKQETLGLTYIKYKDNEELKWAAGLFEGEGSLDF